MERTEAIGNMHENSVKFGLVVFELREWTDRQTNGNTHHNTSHHSHGRGNDSIGLGLEGNGGKDEIRC